MDLLLSQTAQYYDVAKFSVNIGTESQKMPRNTISVMYKKCIVLNFA